MNTQDIMITSLETITAFDAASGSYLFTLDELQKASIQQSEDKTDITGKQGRKLNTLKKNKAVTISGSNGLVSGGLLAAQTGSEFADGQTTKVRWTDYLTVNASREATTSYKAIGTVGAEITDLYLKNSDGSLGERLTQAASASTGHFAYAPATKKLSFHTDIDEGQEIVVFFDRNITDAKSFSNSSANYGTKAKLYIDALGEDKCANLYRVQFYIPKADFSGEFTFDMGDNQTVHEFSADALAGSCGNAGEFFTYTIFGANATDYPA